MSQIKLGYCMCGSFCTFDVNFKLMTELKAAGYDIVPIMSFNASSINSRYGKAADFISTVEEIAGKKVIRTIEDAEPIGPKKMTDIMLVSPCTGNTLAKLASSITDTPVSFKITYLG